MSIEELLLKIDDGDNQEIHAEILRQVNSLKAEIESLKCCGNCDFGYTLTCPLWKKYKETRDGDYQTEDSYCDKWQSDGLTRQERQS